MTRRAFRLPGEPAACPGCGVELDGEFLAPADVKHGPQPGDAVVCPFCAAPLLLIPGGFRLIARDEIIGAGADAYGAMMRAVLDVVMRRMPARYEGACPACVGAGPEPAPLILPVRLRENDGMWRAVLGKNATPAMGSQDAALDALLIKVLGELL